MGGHSAASASDEASWFPEARGASRFRFHELQNEEDPRARFYEHFMRAASPVGADLSESLARKLSAEAEYWPRMTFFAAFQDDLMVGTIACISDHPTQGIPFENGHSGPIDLSRVRELGALMEICLLSVSRGFLASRELINGLFGRALACALDRHVMFLGVQSAENRLAMYRKIGFVPITRHPVHKNGTGFPVVPAILNLGKKLHDQNATIPLIIQRMRDVADGCAVDPRRDKRLRELTDAELLALIGGASC